MIEVFPNADPPYVICPVDDMGAVEDAVALAKPGWCVGDNWWASLPDQQQSDGRWKLYLMPADVVGWVEVA